MATFTPVPISAACASVPPCNIVSTGWNSMANFGNEMYETTATYLDTLYNLISPSELDVPEAVVTVDFPNTQLTPPEIGPAPTVPTNLTLNLPPTPSDPTLSAIAQINVPSPPEFLTAFPSVNIPAAPTPVTDQAPSNPPTFVTPTLPDSPDTTLPTAPTLRTLQIPDAPVITIPTFGGTEPGSLDEVFTPTITFSESLYDSTLLDAVQAELLSVLQNGDSGLPDTVIDQIWEKERERELKEYRRGVGTANVEFAARGFEMPPGALQARLEMVERENIDASITMGREKTVENLTRAYEHVKFAIQNTIGLEGQLMNYTNSMYQRLLQVQTALLDAGVAAYNSKVQAYNARVQAYGVYAQVFQTQVQAELTKIEVYRAQIEGQKAIGDLNVQDIEVYKSNIQAIETIAEVYRTEMQAAQIESEVQRVGIDAFRAEVEAYRAKVEAKASEYEGYAQSINGELAKVRLYEVDANAYRAQVDGYRSLVESESTRLRADVDQNRAVIEQYQGRVAAYRALVEAESSRLGAEVGAFGAEVEGYRATIAGETAKTDSQRDNLRAQVDIASNQSQIQLQTITANIQRAQTYLTLYSDILKSSAEVASQMMASTMDTIDLSAKISGIDQTSRTA